MAKWTLSGIIGAVVLLTAASVFFYTSDYKFLLADIPGEVALLEFDSGDKVEIITRSSECDYALFRITKDELTVKCGWRVVMRAKWYLEYFKTYGDDEWVRLQRKPRLIDLGVSQTEDGFIVERKTPYYATASRSGNAGTLTESFQVSKDRLKSSLDFDTDYKSRDWRVIWQTLPNVEIQKEDVNYMLLDKNLNIFYDDKLFDFRTDELAFYKVQKGSFSIDPVIEFGNLTGSQTTGSFMYGRCVNCDNNRNVSFSSGSPAFQADYFSGWIFSDQLRVTDNSSSLCDDSIGNGYCRLSIRNGTEIIAANDSLTITRCLFNQSSSCFDGRQGIESGTSFLPGALNGYDGVLINDTDTFSFHINQSLGDGENISFSQARRANYTLNDSSGSLEMLVQFR